MRITPRALIILSVLVALIYLAFFLLAIFAPFSRNLVREILLHPYTFFILISILFTILTYDDYLFRKKEQKELDKLETKYKGAIKEKLLHRELEPWEQLVLEQKFKKTKEKIFDLDRRSPVFRIQGRLVKLDPTTNGNLRIQEEWTIRGFTINAENFPDIRYKAFREGEELQVEFSPFSKLVWDVFRVVDGKRKWLLNVDHDNFKLVKTELIKVVVRAPFGTHNITKMRSGESLTFTNMGTGEIKEVTIDYIKHYNSLRELIVTEGVVNICPEVETVAEAEALINTYDHYSERISQGGVYAIGIKYPS